MASENIGLICGANTGYVYSVINPDNESELDNPRWLLLTAMGDDKEPMTLVRVPRATYMGYTSHAQVQAFATARLKS